MRIIILAGGNDQIALISELLSRGHYCILVDYFKNPPAKKIANKHIQASSLDVEQVKEIAIHENADLILTACTDQALLTMAKVSEELNLPCYLSYQTAQNVTNKRHMKKIFIYKGIPTAQFFSISNEEELHNIADIELRFPIVVKPVDCNSSKGVVKCLCKDEMITALFDAVKLSRSGSAIAEEFIEGVELSADFFIVGQKAILLCATGTRKKRSDRTFTITQSYYPALNDAQEQTLQDIGQDIADAFNLVDTPMLVQLIRTINNEFYVIEFSARMGGGSKYKLIEVLSGVNIMSEFVNLVLGERVKILPQKRVKFSALSYIYCKRGRFEKLVGLDDAQHFIYKMPGYYFDKAENSGDRVAGFLITATTEDELISRIRKTNASLKVLDERGNDLTLHNLLEEYK